MNSARLTAHSQLVAPQGEERFRAFVTATADVMYIMSPDWTEMRLLDGKNFLPDTMSPTVHWLDQYIPAVDQAAVQEAIRRAIRPGSLFELEHRVIQMDGSIGWIFSRAVPIRNDEGRIIEWFGAARDITRQKQAERMRLDSEERFRIMADSSPFMIWVCDPAGNVEFVNKAYLDFFGVTLQQVMGPGWRSIVHPEDADDYLATFLEAMETHRPWTHEIRARRHDGVWRWLRSQCTPRFSESGEFLGVVGSSPDITEERAAQEALRQGEQQLRLITDSLPALISYVDSGLCYRFVNETYAQWFGRPLDEILNRTVSEVVGDKAFAELRPNMERALSGQTVSFEMTASYRTGVREIEAVYVPDRDASGKVIGFVVLVSDITERKRIEQALRSRTQELETILDLVPLPIWIASDPECKSIYGNKIANTLYGIGQGNLSQSAAPTEAPYVQHLREGRELQAEELPMQIVAATGLPQMDQQVQIRTFDGRLVYLQGNAVPLLNEAGKLRGVICAMMDVTARRQWEEQLRQSEERLRLATETGKIGLWDWDIHSNTTTCTDSLFRIHGISKDAFDGSSESFLRLVHPDDRDQVSRALAQSLAHGAPYQLTFRAINPAGRVTWVYANAIVLRESGKPVRMIGATLDVSDLKRTEAELRQANADLEQFAYTAAHDLQEPLRNVSVFSELLMRRYTANLDGQALKFLSGIRDGVNRMQQLLRDILAYTQAGISDGLAVIDPVDTNEAMQSACNNLEASIRDAGAEVSVQSPLPLVRAKAAHVQQLFQNLIGNAIKYRSPGRKPEVKVTAAHENGHVKFAVSDNGIGIEPEYAQRIFGLFKRLHGGSQYTGTGIGLAICQRLVERYHGRIWVESTPGRGSTFYFTLPI